MRQYHYIFGNQEWGGDHAFRIPIPRIGAVAWPQENAIGRLEPILSMITARVVALMFWRTKIKGARKAVECNYGLPALKEALVLAIRELLREY